MKNNPRLLQATGKDAIAPVVEGQLTEKQKRIADLKKQLLAPMQKKMPVGSLGGGVKIGGGGGGGGGDSKDVMGDKFKRVMDWGTPRLVTKNRQLNLDSSKIESRNLLMKFANVRKGAVDAGPEKPKDENFN